LGVSTSIKLKLGTENLMFKDLPELETNSKALFCCAFDANKTKNNKVNKTRVIEEIFFIKK
jgi:hypothetical protein